jgi:hypothetical protein
MLGLVKLTDYIIQLLDMRNVDAQVVDLSVSLTNIAIID